MKISLVLTLVPSLAFAQSPDMIAKMTDASARYNECAYSSAISRLQSTSMDINLAAEQGFSSCNAEAQMMIDLMTQVGFSAQQVRQAFLDKQTGIKRELRKMVEDVRTGR